MVMANPAAHFACANKHSCPGSSLPAQGTPLPTPHSITLTAAMATCKHNPTSTTEKRREAGAEVHVLQSLLHINPQIPALRGGRKSHVLQNTKLESHHKEGVGPVLQQE